MGLRIGQFHNKIIFPMYLWKYFWKSPPPHPKILIVKINPCSRFECVTHVLLIILLHTFRLYIFWCVQKKKAILHHFPDLIVPQYCSTCIWDIYYSLFIISGRNRFRDCPGWKRERTLLDKFDSPRFLWNVFLWDFCGCIYEKKWSLYQQWH